MVRCFLVVVIFLPSRETPVEIGFYMRKNGINTTLVLTVIALWAKNKTPRSLCIKCGRSVITPHWRRVLHFADLYANSVSSFWFRM